MEQQRYAASPTTGVISEAWVLYKTHWRHLVAIAFVVYLGLALLTAALEATTTWLGATLGFMLSIIGGFWLQGALVEAVQDVRDGRVDLSLADTLARVWPRLGSIIVAGLLAGIGIAVGFLFLIVPGLVLLTWWILVIPVVVLERAGAADAFGRSRELVRGYGWSVFGVILLTVLVLILAGLLIGLALLPLAPWLRGFVSSVVSGTLTAPFVAAAWTVLYFRLRDTKAQTAPPVEPAAPPPTSPAL